VTELFDLSFGILAALSWEPEIRGMLAVAIGFVVWCGSIYLLVATNSGARTGLLIALAGLFGWCGIMGIVWTSYGIGWVGEEPSWAPVEINYEQLSRANTDAVASDPTLSEFEIIPEGTPDYGELEAAALEAFTTQGNPPPFENQADIIIHEASTIGGKPEPASDSMVDAVTNRITNTLRITHPTRYAVVEAQQALDPGPLPEGAAPPEPEPDPDAPIFYMIMVRDLGNLRFTPAAFTFASFVLFGITANVLHRRDQAEAENRAREEPAAV
jgi:hypothetical protein